MPSPGPRGAPARVEAGAETVLTVNRGSSSLKFALFELGSPPVRVLSGRFDRIGLPGGELEVRDLAAGRTSVEPVRVPHHAACLRPLVRVLAGWGGLRSVRAVVHRVVHGGARYRQPQRVDAAMLRELRRLSPFDPEHLPAEIGLMEAVAARYPELAQIACFDTAFHRDLPLVARLLPIPRRYYRREVQRYGFHGLSYAYLMEELARVGGPEAARGRVILAHLGNGASMTAVRQGRSVDTTMSFTPTAGLVMSTRSGDLDPGLLAYLARTEGMTPAQIQTMVNSRSGLLGLSETSSDVRDLLRRERRDHRAREALAVFCAQARKWIGALAAVLGGVETLVFAGGIGENAPALRTRICRGLGFLGVELDPRCNAANRSVISRTGSRATVRVIKTDEELYMARQVVDLLTGERGARRRVERKSSASVSRSGPRPRRPRQVSVRVTSGLGARRRSTVL